MIFIVLFIYTIDICAFNLYSKSLSTINYFILATYLKNTFRSWLHNSMYSIHVMYTNHALLLFDIEYLYCFMKSITRTFLYFLQNKKHSTNSDVHQPFSQESIAILLEQTIITMANKDSCIVQERSSTRLFDLFWCMDLNCVLISNADMYKVVHIYTCEKRNW